jgi:hypothetical protein
MDTRIGLLEWMRYDAVHRFGGMDAAPKEGVLMDWVSCFREMDGEWIRTMDALTDMRDAAGPTAAKKAC